MNMRKYVIHYTIFINSEYTGSMNLYSVYILQWMDLLCYTLPEKDKKKLGINQNQRYFSKFHICSLHDSRLPWSNFWPEELFLFSSSFLPTGSRPPLAWGRAWQLWTELPRPQGCRRGGHSGFYLVAWRTLPCHWCCLKKRKVSNRNPWSTKKKLQIFFCLIEN